jgi:two-component system sensor histidine kinase YesM
VLKYLFQPLVENAILHGLEKKSGAGLCRISFRLDEGYLRFTVEDDGVGIPPAKLAELRSALSQCQLRQVDNFALNNINLQLKLYYGANVSLQIKSEMNKGTRAGFLIPIRGDDHV